MRAYEIITEDIDEGIKDKVAALGLGAALALGGHSVYKNSQTDPKPELPQVSGKVELAPKAPKAAEAPKKALTPEDILKNYATKAGIKGTELAQLLAQAAHETMDFKYLEEIGNSKYFAKKYDPKFNPRKAKILGNTEVGDGEKFKGRGFLQITGRYNYRKAGQALGLPLEENPELLSRPDVAAKTAIWFWQHRVQPHVDDFSNVRQATKKINPGMHGLSQRKEKFKHYHAKTIQPK